MIEAYCPQGQATPGQVKTLLLEALAARALPDTERAVEADRLGEAIDAISPAPSTATRTANW